MDWQKYIIPIVIGGLAAVAELLADHRDFNWSGEGVLHLVEIFIGGAAAAFLLLLKSGGATPGSSRTGIAPPK